MIGLVTKARRLNHTLHRRDGLRATQITQDPACQAGSSSIKRKQHSHWSHSGLIQRHASALSRTEQLSPARIPRRRFAISKKIGESYSGQQGNKSQGRSGRFGVCHGLATHAQLVRHARQALLLLLDPLSSPPAEAACFFRWIAPRSEVSSHARSSEWCKNQASGAWMKW